MHVWFNDIFIGMNTIQEHNECLLWVYEHLKEEKLYISCKKFDPYAAVLNILGCRIDSNGIHADTDKLEKIRSWHVLNDHLEVLHFLGLIKYLSRFLPNIGAYTGPLQNICMNHMPFYVHYFAVKTIEKVLPSYVVPSIVDFLFKVDQSLVVCDHRKLAVSSKFIKPFGESL